MAFEKLKGDTDYQANITEIKKSIDDEYIEG
jgi:hypothetical protein